MTECNQSSFGFENCAGREVVASFDGGTISSDGGCLLLRQTDQRLNLLPRLAGCFVDRRDPERVEHSVLEMLSQRIYGLALGYEDLNDHEDLRLDPLFGVLTGRKDLNRPLAGKSTLNRMELGNGMPDRYKKITFWKDSLDELLVAVFIESHDKPPEQVIIDVRYHRSAVAWKTGGPVLPWLLRLLLLSAAVYFLRRACFMRTTAPVRPRCFGRESERDSTSHHATASGVAGHQNHPAGRLRVLSQPFNELVRVQQRGICVRSGTEPAVAADHRA